MSSISPVSSKFQPVAVEEHKGLSSLQNSVAAKLLRAIEPLPVENQQKKELQRTIERVFIDEHIFAKTLKDMANERGYPLAFSQEEWKILIDLYDEFCLFGFSDLNSYMLLSICSELKKAEPISDEYHSLIGKFCFDARCFLVDLGKFVVLMGNENQDFNKEPLFIDCLKRYRSLFKAQFAKKGVQEKLALERLDLWLKFLRQPAYFFLSSQQDLLIFESKKSRGQDIQPSEHLQCNAPAEVSINFFSSSRLGEIFIPPIENLMRQTALMCDVFKNFYGKSPFVSNFVKLCEETGHFIDLDEVANDNCVNLELPQLISRLKNELRSLQCECDKSFQNLQNENGGLERRDSLQHPILELLMLEELCASLYKNAGTYFLYFKASRDAKALMQALILCQKRRDLFCATRIHCNLQHLPKEVPSVSLQNDSVLSKRWFDSKLKQEFESLYQQVQGDYQQIFGCLKQYKIQYADKEKSHFDSIIEIARIQPIDLEEISSKFQQTWQTQNKIALTLVKEGRFQEAEDFLREYSKLFDKNAWIMFFLIDLNTIQTGKENIPEDFFEYYYLSLFLSAYDRENIEEKQTVRQAEPEVSSQGQKNSSQKSNRKKYKTKTQKINQKSKEPISNARLQIPSGNLAQPKTEAVSPIESFKARVGMKREDFIKQLCERYGFRTGKGGRHPHILDSKGKYVCSFPVHEKTLAPKTLYRIAKTAEEHFHKIGQ